MTVDHARRFIRRALEDRELRQELNLAGGRRERERILAKHSLFFDDVEFEEAYTNLLLQCQERDQAEQLKELHSWWDFVRHS